MGLGLFAVAVVEVAARPGSAGITAPALGLAAGGTLALSVRLIRLGPRPSPWNPAWRALQQALGVAAIGLVIIGGMSGLHLGVVITAGLSALLLVLAIPGRRREKPRSAPWGTDWAPAAIVGGRVSCRALSVVMPEGWLAWNAEGETVVLVPAETRLNLPVPAIAIGVAQLGEHSVEDVIDLLRDELSGAQGPIEIANLRRSSATLGGAPSTVLDMEVRLLPAGLGLSRVVVRPALWLLGVGRAVARAVVVEDRDATFLVGFVAWRGAVRRAELAFTAMTESARWQ